MKARFFCLPFLALVLILLGNASNRVALALDETPRQNSGAILAPSYILMDVETGRVLASRNERQRRFPASTTKTMTALLAVENGDLNRTVTIGPNPPKIGEASIYLQQGEQFVLRDLVEAAMIKSANDSCVAIAEGVAGTEKKFVQMMNQKAKSLGARDTHYVNPHGLHDPNHYTTANDLALVARAAMKHSVFNEIIATRVTSIHGNAKLGADRVLKNRNKLMFRWNECDGVKTGYTRQAGRCLVASATRLDTSTRRAWRLLSVVLHSPDSWQDSENLLRWGFKNYTPLEVAHAGQTLANLNVRGGARQVEAIAAREIRLPLRGSDQSALSSHVRSLEPDAPVERGQTVAYLEWSLNDKKIAEVPLVARESVGKSLPARVLPAAAPIVPSQPLLRWSIYACAVAGILCLFAGWKVRAHEKERERRAQDAIAARRLIG